MTILKLVEWVEQNLQITLVVILHTNCLRKFAAHHSVDISSYTEHFGKNHSYGSVQSFLFLLEIFLL